MTCFNPIHAFRTRHSSGDEYSLKEPAPSGFRVDRVEYVCGKCVGCVKAHRQMWAMRLHHESQYHEVASFITLTYEDKYVPHGEIPYVHFKAFVDRLRVAVGPFRYFVAAEYGSRTGRPHFHAILFGYYPPDCVSISSGASQLPLFSSSFLLGKWLYGHVSVAPFTPATAGYVAGYVTKKVRLSQRSSHDVISGYDLPEYHKSSTRPGIGFDWIMEFHKDVLRDGYCIHSGLKYPIPRYYRKVLAKYWPDEYQALCDRREDYFSNYDPESALDRRLVSERVELASSKSLLSRSL